MGFPTNADGSLRAFNADEIKAMELRTADIRDGSHPTFQLDSQGCSIRRAWFCKWSQKENAMAALLGGAKLVGSRPNYTLSRVMPMVFPGGGYDQFPVLALESVTGARSAGLDDANTVPAYTHAKIIARHELVWFGLGADGTLPEYKRYVEPLPSTVETSYLSLPGSFLKYRVTLPSFPTPDGLLIPYGIGRPEVLTRLAYKWRRVPYDAWTEGSPLYKRVHGDPTNTTLNASGRVVGRSYIGTVNRLSFFGYPAGYVMFDGVEEEIVPDPIADYPCWNLIFKFTVKPVTGGSSAFPVSFGGHNYLYYSGLSADFTSGYYLAIKGDTWIANGVIPDGKCLFDERDHKALWNVGAVNDLDV